MNKKGLRSVFALASFATVAFGCSACPGIVPEGAERPISFSAEGVGTRTVFGEPAGNTYPTLWTHEDSFVKIILNMDPNATKDAAVSASADYTKAAFSASFADAESYAFYSISPASAWFSSTVANGRLGITVPDLQNPSSSSVDPLAQVLIARTSTSATRPDHVDLQFRHWTSYGKITLNNLVLGDAVIESVDLTAEVAWAGRWWHYFETDTDAAYNGSKTITVKTATDTDIWFACAPVDMSGKKLTVNVRTDKGTHSKTFTMPSGRNFIPGQIARFSVDMSGASFKEAVVYELVTDISQLTEYSKVIIAAASDSNPYAISTTQNSPPNRSGTYVSKANGRLIDPSGEVEIFTVLAGLNPGTFSFLTSKSKYIYASNTGSSSSTGLRSGDSQNVEGSWTITFEDGKTRMVSPSEPRNTLQCYTYKGVFLFNTYVADASKDYVNIYKLAGSSGSEIPEAATIEESWKLYTQNELAEAFYKKQITLGSYTMPLWWEVRGEKPSDGYSLYISLHGGGSTTASENDSQWNNQKTLYKSRINGGVYLCPRAIMDRYDMHSVASADPFYERIIRMAVVYLDVNPDKVYLMGYSAGGDGVWQEGPRMADHWAAASMMAGHPNGVSLLSLRNLPFMVWCGENDTAYDRNTVCAEYIAKLDALQAADPEGYVHEGHIVPGKAHWMDGEDAAAVAWMAKYKRNPYPTRVVWQQTNVMKEFFYWLGIPKAEAKKGNKLIVNRSGNVITIDECDYSSVRIYLNEKMVDFSQPVTVKKGETVLYQNTVTPSEELRKSTLFSRHDLSYCFPCCIEVAIP